MDEHLCPALDDERRSAMMGSPLLAVWVTFTAFSLLGIFALLVWAVRARQFGNQDHARHLPLLSGIPKLDSGRKTNERSNPCSN
jgi:nitrogen fixation-related uncharacterized protein